MQLGIAIYSLLVLPFVAVLLFLHLYLISNNLTTYEFLKREETPLVFQHHLSYRQNLWFFLRLYCVKSLANFNAFVEPVLSQQQRKMKLRVSIIEEG